MATFAPVSGQFAQSSDGNAATLNTALTNAPASGRLVVAWTAAGLHPSTVADSDANAFTKLFDFDAGGGVRMSLWYKLYASAPAAPYSVDADFSGSTYCTLYVCEFATDGTFASSTPQFDTRTGAASATPITDTMTTSVEAGLVALLFNQIGTLAAAPTANSPYTLLDYNNDGAVDGYSCWSYRSGSQAAGNHSTGWTVPSSTAYGSVIIAFEVTAATGYSVGPASASYSITGSGVTLKADRLAQPAARNISITGSGVSLLKGYLLQAASANISLTGSGVEFPRTYQIQPAAANIAIAGTSEFRADRLIQPAAASITIAGSAEFSRTTAGAYTLDAAGAHIDINGSARLAVDRYLSAAQADFSITGSGVTLKADRLLGAASAHYDITGSGVTLSAPIHYTLACASAHIDLNAHDATFVWSGEPVVSRPDGGGRGKRILFRGKVYDSVRDRLYLAQALSEFVEEKVDPPVLPKRRKKQTTALPQFTPAELVELPPVIDVARELDKKLADYVADLVAQQLAQEEEELFLMMAA